MTLSKDVLQLINAFGRDTTLSKVSYGSYNPATGTVINPTQVDYTVKCFFADFTLSEIDSDNIYLGDRKAYLPTVDTSGVEIPLPDAEDTISGAGDDVKIVRVQELWSGEARVCYICQVRG